MSLMIDAFRPASEQIREIADASDGTIQIHDETTRPSGYRQFEISIRFESLERVEDGLRVRARELFYVIVPPTFPFNYPTVKTPHVRFSGFRHVQWRQYPCLYQSSKDWYPGDGMYGFIRKLDSWIRNAALNNLDPDDAPLHPPVVYPTVNRLFVPKANTPLIDGYPWFGFAELRERDNRTEIIGWKKPGEKCLAQVAPAILLHKPLPFEYPKTVNSLLKELESHGIEYASFISLLVSYAQFKSAGTSLNIILGTPMRRISPDGPALQHLAVWEISVKDANKLRELNIATKVGNKVQRDTAVKAVIKWSILAEVGWCMVREMRPEVTMRRDHSSPMAWFRGKRVAIWGCGAVGTHVAESIVRAGVESIELVDNKTVTPGLLVRQGFEDADIGKFKAEALCEKLKRINLKLEAVSSTDDLIKLITGSNPIPKVDLIIDCTASSTVQAALERVLRDIDSRPIIGSIAIDSQAALAIATLSMPSHSGITLDLIRKLKLEACRRPKLSKLLEAFWSKTGPNERFQPEPGCSEPTFIGSNADLAGLSACMLNSIARAIATSNNCYTGAGWLLEESGSIHAFTWPSDHILRDKEQGYSIRVCPHVEREMRGWARHSVRTVGEKIETGGLVFGELNEAAGVLWVTDVEGPPPDSQAAEDYFTCGTEGMKEAAQGRYCRFRKSVDCLGSWHTHPTSAPYPSDVDIHAVEQLLADRKTKRKTCLILILSGNPDDPVLGAYIFRKKLSDEKFVQTQKNVMTTTRLGQQPKKPRNIGLAFSGGGSRAIAFHLGCLRALYDLNLLNRVQVISSVSGGSVISAMYAYSNDSFQKFDERVVQLLNRGLHRNIFYQVLKPSSIWKSLQILVTTSAYFFVHIPLRIIRALVRLNIPINFKPPPMRAFSRTEAFRAVISKSLFGNIKVHNVSRGSFDTVINATELRTGSAFRFGSQQSGCWRFGTIAHEAALVSDAVAASAAYPACFPALERKYRFTKNKKTTKPTRVLLTDGGVFENLGVSPMEPGRVSSISTNVFNPDYIICCDAGAGLFDDESYPTYWPCRMYRSFLTVFRKVQDATRKKLHFLSNNGKISGFTLCYLGQQDNALPWMPAGLPKREEVQNYPTDFAAMSTEDIDRLARRGELLMRFLISYYLPDL